jgi:hypothetical protein
MSVHTSDRRSGKLVNSFNQGLGWSLSRRKSRSRHDIPRARPIAIGKVWGPPGCRPGHLRQASHLLALSASVSSTVAGYQPVAVCAAPCVGGCHVCSLKEGMV